MKKAFTIVLIMSFLFILASFYVNYYYEDLYVLDFDNYDEVMVNSNYVNERINLCYGTKHTCKNINYTIKGKVDTKKVGTYFVTYEANYKGKHFKIEKEVKVVDKKSPKLVIEGAFTNVCPNGKVKDVKVRASDNYDGDITDKIEYKVSGNKIIYKVSDSSGNTTRKEFDVIIMDNEKPTIILNGDNPIYLAKNEKYKEPGYVAIDDCDGNITEEVIVTSNLDTKKEGTYYINYEVTDSSGNKNTVKREIIVIPKNNYEEGKTYDKVIYLTFDDGPGPYTEKLLDILDRYNVKATFFVTGYDDRYNDVLKKEYEKGHTIGLHSFSHNYGLIYSSVDNYLNDLLKIQDKVKRYTGFESKIVRFPGGSSNTVSKKYAPGIMSELTNKLNEMGYKYYDWNILSGDAGETTDPNVIVKNVTNAIKENKENMVLMHDIKPYTVDAIERIIHYGLTNGYTFAPITMDTKEVHHNINN